MSTPTLSTHVHCPLGVKVAFSGEFATMASRACSAARVAAASTSEQPMMATGNVENAPLRGSVGHPNIYDHYFCRDSYIFVVLP